MKAQVADSATRPRPLHCRAQVHAHLGTVLLGSPAGPMLATLVEPFATKGVAAVGFTALLHVLFLAGAGCRATSRGCAATLVSWCKRRPLSLGVISLPVHRGSSPVWIPLEAMQEVVTLALARSMSRVDRQGGCVPLEYPLASRPHNFELVVVHDLWAAAVEADAAGRGCRAAGLVHALHGCLIDALAMLPDGTRSGDLNRLAFARAWWLRVTALTQPEAWRAVQRSASFLRVKRIDRLAKRGYLSSNGLAAAITRSVVAHVLEMQCAQRARLLASLHTSETLLQRHLIALRQTAMAAVDRSINPAATAFFDQWQQSLDHCVWRLMVQEANLNPLLVGTSPRDALATIVALGFQYGIPDHAIQVQSLQQEVMNLPADGMQWPALDPDALSPVLEGMTGLHMVAGLMALLVHQGEDMP